MRRHACREGLVNARYECLIVAVAAEHIRAADRFEILQTGLNHAAADSHKCMGVQPFQMADELACFLSAVAVTVQELTT